MGKLSKVLIICFFSPLLFLACATSPRLDQGYWQSETAVGDVPVGELVLSFSEVGGNGGAVYLRSEAHSWPWRRFRWLVGEDETLLLFPVSDAGEASFRTLIYGYTFVDDDTLVLSRDPDGAEAVRLRRAFDATSGLLEGPARFRRRKDWWAE